jgi:hypothetical protein
MSAEHKKLLHIHVPKTGGSWLNSQLEKHFPHRYLGHRPWHVKLSSIHNAIPNAGRNDSVCASVAYGSVPFITCHDPLDREWAHTVSICRNPFDYLVSFYHHHNPIRSSYGAPSGCNDVNTIHGFRSFEEFIKKFCDPGFPFAQEFDEVRAFLFYQMFDDTGRCGVDVIFKNEQLHSATELFISSTKRSPIVLNKRRENTSKLREKKDYRSYYTDELRELVELKCAAELMLFGYDFDGSPQNPLFVDPDSLFYYPVYPVAGINLPDWLIDAHEQLISANSKDPLSWRLRGARHITPDIFINLPNPPPIKEQFSLGIILGNPGDPKPIAEVYSNKAGRQVEAHTWKNSPYKDTELFDRLRKQGKLTEISS